jgi:hypothetical protein
MHFAVTFFQILKEEEQWEEMFAARITFSDETAFQLSGYVNRHNIRVWGINSLSATIENTRDGPKLECPFSVSKQTCSSLTFFADRSMNGAACRCMMEEILTLAQEFFVTHFTRSHT